jgi:hypothetical protein
MSKNNCGEFSPLDNKKKGWVATHIKDFLGKNGTK